MSSTEQMYEPQSVYKKEGAADIMGNVWGIVILIVGVGVAAMVLIFVGALGGQVYNQTQGDITSINDTTIREHVVNSITSGFAALETTGNYLPIVVMAVIIAVVLSLITGLIGNVAGPAYYGTAGGGTPL